MNQYIWYWCLSLVLGTNIHLLTSLVENDGQRSDRRQDNNNKHLFYKMKYHRFSDILWTKQENIVRDSLNVSIVYNQPLNSLSDSLLNPVSKELERNVYKIYIQKSTTDVFCRISWQKCTLFGFVRHIYLCLFEPFKNICSLCRNNIFS